MNLTEQDRIDLAAQAGGLDDQPCRDRVNDLLNSNPAAAEHLRLLEEQVQTIREAFQSLQEQSLTATTPIEAMGLIDTYERAYSARRRNRRLFLFSVTGVAASFMLVVGYGVYARFVDRPPFATAVLLQSGGNLAPNHVDFKTAAPGPGETVRATAGAAIRLANGTLVALPPGGTVHLGADAKHLSMQNGYLEIRSIGPVMLELELARVLVGKNSRAVIDVTTNYAVASNLEGSLVWESGSDRRQIPVDQELFWDGELKQFTLRNVEQRRSNSWAERAFEALRRADLYAELEPE